MIVTRNRIDKIIITAMDRFVWFVLLVVMSHLVTEFTRVTGYARGSRHEIVLVNDTLLRPMPVQNMVLYPGHDYGLYDRPNVPYSGVSGNGLSNGIEQHAAYVAGSSLSGATGSNNAAMNSAGGAAANNEQGFQLFSFRPLIDSIFEIPISTLRAVNTLVARLTGSYRQASPTTPEVNQKSALETAEMLLPAGNSNRNLRTGFQESGPGTKKGLLDEKPNKSLPMREVQA